MTGNHLMNIKNRSVKSTIEILKHKINCQFNCGKYKNKTFKANKKNMLKFIKFKLITIYYESIQMNIRVAFF